MTKLWSHWPLIVLCAACASQAAPVVTGKRASEPCPSFAGSGLSEAAAARMAGASNLLEYENIWKETHPGSSTGTISGAGVRSVIHSKLHQLEACYQLALYDSREVAGRVVVRFVVNPSGRVATANISANSFGRSDIGCCVLARVAEWAFPAPNADGFVVVEYPFNVRVSY